VDAALRRVKWIKGGLWLGSWYLMWLEVFRWKHVTRSLAFNAGPPIPGTNIHIKPGRPLKARFVCAFDCRRASASTIASTVAAIPGWLALCHLRHEVARYE
jgi:hypothetical protein